MGPITRVSVISTGQVRIRPQHERSNGTPLAWWLFTSRTWTAPRPINVYVIEHERGLVLFDTGQDRHSVTDPDYFPGGMTRLPYRRLARFEIEPDETLTAQLGRLGYAPGDVAVAVLSHLHQDHIGGLPELTGTRILVGAAEWATLDAPLPELNGLMRNHIRIPGLNWEQVQFGPLGDESLRPFESGHDLFGDGSLVLLPTPGHTPGSLSLLLRQEGLAPMLFVGDLTYDIHLFDDDHVPGVGRRRDLLASTQRVKALRDAQPGLIVAAAHDPGAADAVRRAVEGPF
ncbi:N-acyl homoserine lactonase family protein [Diaminobutyricibacter tongyongensis]|uniref:N-acyl homoserine lactonase family protein n=1 Tax=Leifsonia tongyongensis TaxID=1268043 RepID=A0A6L9XY13_9MICO|nr:N-acyl homoserine lactonase family protein [Diaminobutyricibacter tongyongensis]NEN06135.1 N-acyl homoserine lactonase family protein [Diaminobutyricibacter tongyongensis]